MTEYGRTSLLYRGPLTWNAIPHEIRCCKNKETFKRKLRMCKVLDKIQYQKEAAIGTARTLTFFIVRIFSFKCISVSLHLSYCEDVCVPA